MSLSRVIAEYAKHAPAGYVHVSEYARAHKLNAKKVSAIAAKAPDAVRVANYIFVPPNFRIEVRLVLDQRKELVDRYARA